MGTQIARRPPGSPVSSFDFQCFSESDLSRLWQDQTFPAEALTTTAGERLRVVYRGRRTGGPGPDFRDALIAAPGGLLRGDVELHVRSSDFPRHGHHCDPAYSGVVLHVVFVDDSVGGTLLPGGGRPRVIALGAWVEGRAQEIRRWLERPALWREPCFSALSRQGPAAVGGTLDRLGDMRFRAKAAAVARAITSADAEAVLWQALLEALAFGSERRDVIGALTERAPWPALREELLALPAATRAKAAYARLAEAAPAVRPAGPRPARPGNRRADRLKGAAALAARFAERGLVDYFVGLVGGGEERPSTDRVIENEKLENGTRPAPARFGVSSFETRAPCRPAVDKRTIAALIAALTIPGLIGRERAVEVLANAALPCLAALGPEVLARRAEALYQRLPLPARYGAVRHLHQAVGRGPGKTAKRKAKNGSTDIRFSSFDLSGPGGAAGGAGIRVDSRRQQGMLYLLKQYCTQGGCGRCPLS